MSTTLEADTLKVHDFRPRSSSAGPGHIRENNEAEAVVIVKKMAKITLTECSGSAEIPSVINNNNNNNNFLKCPTSKKLTTSRSNPQLGELVKEPCTPLMDIPPPDYDQIRRSLSPCRLSPEVQSLVENF